MCISICIFHFEFDRFDQMTAPTEPPTIKAQTYSSPIRIV